MSVNMYYTGGNTPLVQIKIFLPNWVVHTQRYTCFSGNYLLCSLAVLLNRSVLSSNSAAALLLGIHSIWKSRILYQTPRQHPVYAISLGKEKQKKKCNIFKKEMSGLQCILKQRMHHKQKPPLPSLHWLLQPLILSHAVQTTEQEESRKISPRPKCLSAAPGLGDGDVQAHEAKHPQTHGLFLSLLLPGLLHFQKNHYLRQPIKQAFKESACGIYQLQSEGGLFLSRATKLELTKHGFQGKGKI